MNCVEAHGITKSYGGVAAVKGVNFYARQGETVGIIGSNGAGKTTLLNILTAFEKPDEGSIIYNLNGKSFALAGLSACAAARRGVGRTFQSLHLFEDMTVEQNLLAAVIARGQGFNSAGWLKRTGLIEKKDLQVSMLSYGERKYTELIRAAAGGCKILYLDEPAAGLNTAEAMRAAKIISEIKTALNLTVVMIEHNMEFMLKLCHRLYCMDLGSVIAEGEPAEVVSRQAVKKAVFGGGELFA